MRSLSITKLSVHHTDICMELAPRHGNGGFSGGVMKGERKIFCSYNRHVYAAKNPNVLVKLPLKQLRHKYVLLGSLFRLISSQKTIIPTISNVFFHIFLDVQANVLVLKKSVFLSRYLEVHVNL